jgi:hypothetical protein
VAGLVTAGPPLRLHRNIIRRVPSHGEALGDATLIRKVRDHAEAGLRQRATFAEDNHRLVSYGHAFQDAPTFA